MSGAGPDPNGKLEVRVQVGVFMFSIPMFLQLFCIWLVVAKKTAPLSLKRVT